MPMRKKFALHNGVDLETTRNRNAPEPQEHLKHTSFFWNCNLASQCYLSHTHTMAFGIFYNLESS